MSRLRDGKSWSTRIFLYPWRRIGLIHVNKTLLKTPWSSSGDWCLLRALNAGCLARHSSTKSVECMQQRRSTGREVFVCLTVLEGIVRWTASHSIDARRYSVAKSEALWDRCCSWRRSRLRPRAASIEANSETKKLVLCWTSKIENFVQYDNNMTESNNPRAYGRYWY